MQPFFDIALVKSSDNRVLSRVSAEYGHLQNHGERPDDALDDPPAGLSEHSAILDKKDSHSRHATRPTGRRKRGRRRLVRAGPSQHRRMATIDRSCHPDQPAGDRRLRALAGCLRRCLAEYRKGWDCRSLGGRPAGSASASASAIIPTCSGSSSPRPRRTQTRVMGTASMPAAKTRVRRSNVLR